MPATPQEREKLGKAAAGADEEDTAAPGPGSNIFAQQQVDFATPRGRAVYNALFRKPPNRRHLIREMFLPRRTAFMYDFDPETGGGDVPTTLRRSKADCPPVQVNSQDRCV
jgi:IK cytokine